jgi:NTE family protein
VLPGAGARGAYQVGVLKAVAQILPKNAHNPFAIISGTSAGAINAAVLAGRAANFERAIRDMERVWANFSADQVYRTDNWTMLKTSLHWLAAAILGGLGVRNPISLLDNAPLRYLLSRDVRFGSIARGIRRRAR